MKKFLPLLIIAILNLTGGDAGKLSAEQIKSMCDVVPTETTLNDSTEEVSAHTADDTFEYIGMLAEKNKTFASPHGITDSSIYLYADRNTKIVWLYYRKENRGSFCPYPGSNGHYLRYEDGQFVDAETGIVDEMVSVYEETD